MSNKVTGKCTVERFWEEVALIGWQDKNPRKFCGEAKARLLRRWDAEFLAGFDALKGEFYSKMARAVEAKEEETGESCHCGDDSFSDLMNHMIGLGREEYEAGLEDPMRVIHRGRDGRYDESFSYCIPYKSDGQYINKDHYIKRTEEIVEDLQGLKNSRFGEEFEDLDGLLALMKRVLDGEVELLATEGLPERVKKLREERDARYYEEMEALNDLRSQSWLIDNTVSDYRTYMAEEAR